jgi:hypothetical protein
MSIIIYFACGLSLIWYLISPAHRRNTNDRWKATRPSRLVYEIGTGIIGVIVLGTLLLLLIQRLAYA